MKTARTILDSIGNTPMVRLQRLARDIDAEVLVKVEYLNPSGSVKDRVALRMIRDAERDGRLKKGMEIIEATTGNMGAALAFVGAACGYPLTMYVPKSVLSEERIRLCRAYGAKVVRVDIEDVIHDSTFPQGVHGSRVELIPRRVCLQREKTDKNVWWARQFSNPSNRLAHKEWTGAEILEQTDGRLDVFVAALGTGGTFLGVAEALREANTGAKAVAVEPEGHRTIVDGKLTLPLIEGVSGGLMKELVDRQMADDVMAVTEEDAIRTAHELAEQEGLFCGLSSGANVYAALQIAKTLKKGQRVVTILVDSRDRYLFTERLTT
ncbi:MAG: cysteine synthase family protein [Firmicutes bacterium]|jgi:cysteine synthase A|nr:cysteine synthase family protein [Bacillota bacterium]